MLTMDVKQQHNNNNKSCPFWKMAVKQYTQIPQDETCYMIVVLCARDKIAESENSVDPAEVAHKEPPHLELYCLLSSLWILNMK